MNNNTIFVVPNDREILNKLDGFRVIGVDPYIKSEVRGIIFEPVPAYNVDKSFHPIENGWLGYIVYLDKTYYIMGDTDLTEDALKIKCDHLFIPIGGTYTMDYKQASKLTNIIKPKVVTPTHYGSIVGTKEDGHEFSKLVDDGIEVQILL